MVKLVGDIQTALAKYVIRLDTLKETPFPICLFVFVMNTDQGYYRWLLEPIVSQQSGPELRWSTDGAFVELSDQSFDQLVEHVDRWYDARQRQ